MSGQSKGGRPSPTEFRVGHLWPSVSVLTVLTYNTWLLWRPLNGHAKIFDGYLSELSASDQPHSFFFRGGDLITAVIVLALAIRAIVLWRRRTVALAKRGEPRPGRWWVVAWSALLIFGVATFFDAFFAMDCSPTLSETCRVAEETGRLSTVHYAHTYTSVGAQIGIVASMVATAIAMARSPWQSRTRTRVVVTVAALEVVALVVMMIMLGLRMPGLGYPQAVMVVVASLWFAAIGFRLVGDDADPRGHPGTSASGASLVGSDHG
jgi:F0F1-type ATP synthase membrane subunit c/vacuolar-type H+-ATPase subunit K